jgi:hypothetical protein
VSGAMATPRLERLGRFALRGLRIAASTVSLVELLRSEWAGGAAAAAAWLLFVQVERRWPAGTDAQAD